MRFSADFLEEIKARLPISQIVGARVRFDAKKSNPARGDYWACCPFHGEKTPSFHCDDRRGRYHCFGCGASGDIFRFLTELDGLSFFEAVERLAGQAGLALPAPDPAAQAREQQRATLYDALAAAAKFYEQALQGAGAEAAAARAYLQQRGLTTETQRRFRLGYAPAGNALRSFLAVRGINEDLQRQAGLLAEGEAGREPYDRFRSRIIFPIADMRGRIIAFGGRAMSAEARAKYLNSPETDLFHKGHILYNLANARAAARGINGAADKPLIVVEGYMDVIALAQAGFGQAVAPLGTALTEEQLALLWRLCPQPILCFDGDAAGLKAAYRALDRALPLLKAGASLQFMLLPGGQDPDEIIRAEGAAAFAALLAQALPLADILWRRETEGQNFATPESRAALESRLKTAAFTIKDTALRNYYLQYIRQHLWEYFRARPSAGGSGRQGGYGGGNGRQSGRGYKDYKSGGYGAYGGNNLSGGAGGGLITDSLARSAFVRAAAGGGGPAPRDAVILALLAAHPALWHENIDGLAELEFAAPALRDLHGAMLEALAELAAAAANSGADGGEAAEISAADLAARLAEKGQGAALAKIAAFAVNLGVKAARAEALPGEAREALAQALTLYRRAHFLRGQIREIEEELLNNAENGSFARLLALKRELSRADNLEAAADSPAG